MKSVISICFFLMLGGLAHAAGNTDSGRLSGLEVYSDYFIFHLPNTKNPDSCTGFQQVILQNSHPTAKQIYSIASLAYASSLNVSFAVDGCLVGGGAYSLPVVTGIKVGAF